MSDDQMAELERLRAENSELRRQLEARDGEIAALRHVVLSSGQLPPTPALHDVLRMSAPAGRA